MRHRVSMSVTVNLRKLYMKMVFERRRYVKVSDLASELCVSIRTAHRIMRAMKSLGYAERWSGDIYVIKNPGETRDKSFCGHRYNKFLV